MVSRHDHVDRLELQLNTARTELERRIRDGRFDGVEALSAEFPELWSNSEAALELIYTEYVARIENGQSPDREEWYRRFPTNRDRLERLFGLYDLMTARDTQTGLSETGHQDDEADDCEDGDDQPRGYTLLDEIGRGGSAVVYRARQHSLNRLVAIKILRDSPWLKDYDGRQLRSEAELVARLQHPNIVQVFEVGTWDAAPFLAMELVPGAGLHTFLADSHRHGSVGLTSDRAAELVETLTRAMSYAHQQGVVHRDLKPANVLIAPANGDDWPPAAVKIADFGLAVVCDTSQAVTQTLAIAGTPCYMAPEQAEGRNAEVGPQTDIYALGAILYELLTARPPFQGATIVETLDMVRMNEPVPPRTMRSQVPRDLETICLKCLNKSPGKRYLTSLELAEDLRRFREGKPIVARPVSALERGYKWVKRYPAVAGLSFALVAAIAAAGAVQTNRLHESEVARQKEHQLNEELQANMVGRLVVTARALWSDNQVELAQQTLAECPESMRGTDWQAMHRLCHAEVGRLSDRVLGGDGLAVSSDGEFLAFGRYVRGVAGHEIINTRTGRSVDSSILAYFPNQLGFTRDGQDMIAIRAIAPATETGGASGKVVEKLHAVVVRNLASKKMSQLWVIKDSPMAALSPSGQCIASVAADKVQIWDSRSGKVISELGFSDGDAMQRTLSWDGHDKFLMMQTARGASATFKVWDVETGKLIAEPATVPNILSPAALSVDGKFMAIQSQSPAPTPAESYRRLVVRKLSDGSDVCEIRTPGIISLTTFDRDGRRLAFHMDRQIELYDANTGGGSASLRGHSGRLRNLQFSPDGRKLYSLSIDKTLRTWDISPWCD